MGIAAVLFGLVHFAGGLELMLLASVAGIGPVHLSNGGALRALAGVSLPTAAVPKREPARGHRRPVQRPNGTLSSSSTT